MKKITGLLMVMLPGLILIIPACLKIEKLPPEPRIEFISFTVSDTTDLLGNQVKAGKLKFYFEDGDGDIGLKESPTSGGDSRNLFLTLYRKTAGVMEPALPDDPVYPSSYRLPYIERTGQNKLVKGKITILMLYLFYQESDTIMYEFYIQDRAKHNSNTAATCEIPLFYNGTYM